MEKTNVIFGYNTGTNQENTIPTLVPGAYLCLYNDYNDNMGPCVPIYNSISKLGNHGNDYDVDFLNDPYEVITDPIDNNEAYRNLFGNFITSNDNKHHAIVLPGYKLIIYRSIHYIDDGWVYTIDNTGGTDVKTDGIDLKYEHIGYVMGSVKIYYNNIEIYPTNSHVYDDLNVNVLVHSETENNGSQNRYRVKEFTRLRGNLPSVNYKALQFYDVGKIQNTSDSPIDVSCLIVGGGGSSGQPNDSRVNNSSNYWRGGGAGGGGGYAEGNLTLHPNIIYEISVGRGAGGFIDNGGTTPVPQPGGDTTITGTDVNGNNIKIISYGGGPGSSKDNVAVRKSYQGGSNGGDMYGSGYWSDWNSLRPTRGKIEGTGIVETTPSGRIEYYTDSSHANDNTLLAFYGNNGGSANDDEKVGSGGGGAGGVGGDRGTNGDSKTGKNANHKGATGGIGKTWLDNQVYAGGGGGGGAYIFGSHYAWRSGVHGGGNYHGGGGGGIGYHGRARKFFPGWTGTVILAFPTNT